MSKAKINDWHSPHNEACAQNRDIDRDCECKRPKRNRKPYRVCRVHDDEVPHNVRPDIIMEVHPNGRLVFREKGRPRSKSYATSVAKVYGRMLMAEALAKAKAKKARRRGRA